MKLKLFVWFLIMGFVFQIFALPAYAALSEEQKSVFRRGILHYDVDGNQCTAGTSSTVANRSIYVLGDSYGGGYGTPLTDKLKSNGFDDIVINASSGRSISGAGTNPKTSGLDAVAGDKDIIANKGVIVIELGTNPENKFKDNQEQLINDLQKINPDAKYYWVNVGNYDDNDDATPNKVIANNASGFNYSVIDWKAIADKKYFETDDIHPSSNNGYEVYAKLIADSVGQPPTQASSGTTTVVSGFLTTDASKSNGERIWSFLTSPQGLGLNSYQAAGVMGNIRQEAGENYSAGAAENGGSGPGRGIVQWTSGGRKANLEKFTEANGSVFQDALDLQLNFMKHELQMSYKDTLTMLKASDANTLSSSMKISDPVVAAAVIFHGPGGPKGDTFKVPGLKSGYEASGDTLEFVKETRGKKYGYEALEKFGGGQGIGSTSPVTGVGCEDTYGGGIAGEGGWDLSAMTLYNQGGGDPWTKQNFSRCGTLGQCGCPVITSATIISTLTSTKIDPGQLRDAHPGDQSWTNVTSQYGLKKTELGRDAGAFVEAAKILESGGLVTVHITNGGEFIDGNNHSTHYFVMRKVQDGKFYIYFLYKGDYNEKGFTPSDFTNGGLENMWGFTKE